MLSQVAVISWAVLMGLWGSSAVAAVQVQKSAHAAQYQFWVDGIDIQDAHDDRVPSESRTVYLQGLEGYITTVRRIGEPEIPVIRFYVDAKGDIDVIGEFGFSASSSSQVEKTKISGIVKPAQPPRVKKADSGQAYVVNEEIYNSNGCYGEDELIQIEHAGSIRGWDRHIVTVFPMCYNPQEQELIWRKYIRIKVTGNLRHEVIPEQDLNETIAFVVGKKFRESLALRRYIDFKERLGYVVRRIDLNDKDIQTPENIRSELQALYRSSDINLRYALLIGDVEDVPAKESRYINGVTDHFYRAIDTKHYEKDINGPDIGVGRLSASSEAELEAIVNKYMRYQIGSFADQKWLRRVAFIGTDDWFHWEVAEATHNWVISQHMQRQGFTGSYPERDILGGDTLYYMSNNARNPEIMKTIHEGRAIINYSGHGATTFWDAPRMSQDDIRSLNNESAIPFVVSNACITSQFTVPESFGETWQRHPYGAIVFWGSMDNTYWEEDDVLEKRMYDGIFDNGYRNFRDITHNALSKHWLHFGGRGLSKYYWETYVMLGDPSIDLRLNKSEKIRLHGPSEITSTQKDVIYMATNSDAQPVAGVRVALKLKGEEMVIAVKTDEHGIARFNLRNLHRGAGRFTVSAALQDAGLFISELRVSE